MSIYIKVFRGLDLNTGKCLSFGISAFSGKEDSPGRNKPSTTEGKILSTWNVLKLTNMSIALLVDGFLSFRLGWKTRLTNRRWR